MANTLAKVWTSLITVALTNYIEQNTILSSSQEGFRAQRGTSRQLRNVINAIEDAQLNCRNIYLLYIDFSAAFNMVNHVKLQQILLLLGIPECACANIAALYTKATTRILTPFGPTHDITVRRGTLQGDNLSPLLFLQYIEPLLRWLNQGGRGYHFGSLSTDDNSRYNLSAAAYADDLVALAGTAAELQAISSAWAKLP
jgi:hypothetical protein